MRYEVRIHKTKRLFLDLSEKKGVSELDSEGDSVN